jgi:hypothetical protein
VHVDCKTASLYRKVYIAGFKLFCSRLYTAMKSVRDFTFHSLYVEESGQVFWVVTLSSRVVDYRRFESTWYLVTQWSRTIIRSLGVIMRALGKRACEWSSVTPLCKKICVYALNSGHSLFCLRSLISETFDIRDG